MTLPNVSALSDNGLLHLYGRVATNVMLTRLFSMRGPPQDALDILRELSREISERELDRKGRHADN